MNILFPRPTSTIEWRAHISALVEQPPLKPFDDIALDFIDAVAKEIATDRHLRSSPHAIALAHWMRRAHLLELKREFERLRDGRLLAPRGMALHFAPANVDTLFIYSWFLSLLVGNSNVVRVSTSREGPLHSLVTVLSNVVESPRFGPIRARNVVLTYPHNDEVTEFLSRKCHVRVVWGGDQSVQAIRRAPLAPLAVELPFADRFSLAVLAAEAVLACDVEQLRRLAHRFCNDAFVFDQMACSSPRLVFWVGTSATLALAKPRFWAAVREAALGRGIEYPDVVRMDRATTIFTYAALGQIAASTAPSDFPAVATLAADARDFRALHCGAGLFLEASLDRLEDILTFVSEKDQTLGHFGFQRAELESVAARMPARAVDRIVPIGEALTFSHLWDGINLLQSFTRIIDIKG